MDFAQQQRNPMRHLVSIGLVLLLHVLIVWALMSGLARKVVQVIQAPIETKIIEEVTPPPPPPPEVKLPTPPKFQPPPPLYVPPPEVVVQTPPPPNVVTAITTTPPVEPPPPIVAAPPPPPAPPAPPAPAPPPAIQSAAVACSNFRTKMGDAAFPREALRQGIDRGEVLIQFTLGPAGQIKDIEVLRASHRVFARQSMQIVSELTCAGQGRDIKVQVPFSYKLE